MNQIELINTLFMQKLNGYLSENDHVDFKQQWYEQGKKIDLLIDIMNFVNTIHHDDCYIIIGISDDGEIVGVNNDENRLNRQELQDFLRRQPFAQNYYPKTDVSTIQIRSPQKNKIVDIDVITIYNTDNVPIYLSKDVKIKNCEPLRAGCIYSRIGDSNTPRNESTTDEQMEKLWKKRFSLDESIFDRYKYVLKDKDNWFYTEADKEPKYIYSYNPDFIIKEVYSDYSSLPQVETWSIDMTNPQVNYKTIQICYRNNVIKEYKYALMDGQQFGIIAPEIGRIENQSKEYFYYFYIRNSLQFLINEMMNNRSGSNYKSYLKMMDSLVIFINSSQRLIIEKDNLIKDSINKIEISKETENLIENKIKTVVDDYSGDIKATARKFIEEKKLDQIISKFIKIV